MDKDSFYTLRGYDRKEHPGVSAAMEDYLEMICRIVREGNPVRVNQLASLLNVTPSSASKMAGRLREAGLVDFERYGVVRLTALGKETGDYLLHRHDVLLRFFRQVNGGEHQLELVEKIEHFIDRDTVENLEKLLLRLEAEE